MKINATLGRSKHRFTQDANELTLYRAPKRVKYTEPGTRKPKDEISVQTSLRSLFSESNEIQMIVQPPGYGRAPLNAVQYNRRSGDLVWKEETFTSFPVHSEANFKNLRQHSEFCFFDKTAFIMTLESFKQTALVLLRPRRSGKSLALSMLEHFHGREHAPDYKGLFGGLAIDEHVKNGRVLPGQYFVLKFDFSRVIRSSDKSEARDSLNSMLQNSIKKFYRTYEPISADYLIKNYINEKDAASSLTSCAELVHRILGSIDSSEDPLSKIKGIYLMADEYDSFMNDCLKPIDNVNWTQPQGAEPVSVLTGFWSSVKSVLGSGISKCYITGISPQSLAASGFNVSRSVSWEPSLGSFCGLTVADVTAALAMKQVCQTPEEAEKHLKIMRDCYNGYNFTPGGQGPLTFNTNTCLEYLQHLLKGNPMEDPLSVTHSEISEASLRLLAASPIGMQLLEEEFVGGDIQDKNLEERTVAFSSIHQTFSLATLAGELAQSKAAWLSFMLHYGGLTFCQGAKKLQIPNLVAAQRIWSAILYRHNASLDDVRSGLEALVKDGSIHKILGLYARGMQKHDVGPSDLEKQEQHHCNSLRFTLLANVHPALRGVDVDVKTSITKPSKTPGQNGQIGRIDMLVSVPLRKQLFVLEWKSIQIDYINIGSGSRLDKANTLARISCPFELLDLKLNDKDKFRPGQTIEEWILTGSKGVEGGSPEKQLLEYVQSGEIEKWKNNGFTITLALAVVVGNRHILLWNFDGDALDKSPQLCSA